MLLEFIRDWDITYPVVFDWEWVGADARTAEVSSRTVTDCTLAFCRMVQEAGYTPPPFTSIRTWRKTPSACGSFRTLTSGWPNTRTR